MEILRRWYCNCDLQMTSHLYRYASCNYHQVILPLQNSGVSKKSAGTLKFSVKEELLNDATLSLCNTTTREISRRELHEERNNVDSFNCCSSQVKGQRISRSRTLPAVLPHALVSPSTFIKESSTSKELIILRSRRYS